MSESGKKGEDGKIKGESATKVPPAPKGADLPTSYAEPQGSGGETAEQRPETGRPGRLCSDSGSPPRSVAHGIRARVLESSAR